MTDTKELTKRLKGCRYNNRLELRTVPEEIVQEILRALAQPAAENAQAWIIEELADADKVLNAIGIGRTEGGRINVLKVLSRIKEIRTLLYETAGYCDLSAYNVNNERMREQAVKLNRAGGQFAANINSLAQLAQPAEPVAWKWRAKAQGKYAAGKAVAVPDDISEWIAHMDLHLTEHDVRHAGLALRAAWPSVRAHFMGAPEPEPAHQLICPRCNVDRLKDVCPEIRQQLCPMMGTPFSSLAAPPRNAKGE